MDSLRSLFSASSSPIVFGIKKLLNAFSNNTASSTIIDKYTSSLMLFRDFAILPSKIYDLKNLSKELFILSALPCLLLQSAKGGWPSSLRPPAADFGEAGSAKAGKFSNNFNFLFLIFLIKSLPQVLKILNL
jgi:hypothetical protein